MGHAARPGEGIIEVIDYDAIRTACAAFAADSSSVRFDLFENAAAVIESRHPTLKIICPHGVWEGSGIYLHEAQRAAVDAMLAGHPREFTPRLTSVPGSLR